MSVEEIDLNKLPVLTLHPEELSVLALNEIKQIDFNEGDELPNEACLQTPDGDYRAKVKRKGSVEYVGGKHIVNYEIIEIL